MLIVVSGTGPRSNGRRLRLRLRRKPPRGGGFLSLNTNVLAVVCARLQQGK